MRKFVRLAVGHAFATAIPIWIKFGKKIVKDPASKVGFKSTPKGLRGLASSLYRYNLFYFNSKLW